MTNRTSQANDADGNAMFLKFLEGNKDALSYYYTFFMNDLYAYGLSLGGDEDIVKDAIQDIFVHVHFNQKKFSSVEHLNFFLLKSLKNKLYNIYSSKRVSTASEMTTEVLNFSITTMVLDTIVDRKEQIII